jgi:hypothetical protein
LCADKNAYVQREPEIIDSSIRELHVNKGKHSRQSKLPATAAPCRRQLSMYTQVEDADRLLVFKNPWLECRAGCRCVSSAVTIFYRSLL